jgi:hypothetical protein
VFECPTVEEGSPWASAYLLRELSEGDVEDPAVAALAIKIRMAGSDGPRGLHAWVKRTVRFATEKVETFQSAAFTAKTGVGDCDDSERLLWAVARAAGIPVRFVFFLQGGQPAHVSAQLHDGASWQWAETSVPAYYGEHPLAALRRLGKVRRDIDGRRWLMYPEGAATPMPKDEDLDDAAPVVLNEPASKNMGALAPLPSSLGSGFAGTLVVLSRGLGIDPFDAAKLLMSESDLTPSATNARGFTSGFAVGINQLAPVNWGYFTSRGFTVDEYRALTAEGQLPIAFAYFASEMKSHGLSSISGRDLYWLNFLPATFVPNAPDSHVIVTSASGFYTNNSHLDHGGKGAITAGDLQLSLDAQERKGEWPALAQAIADAGGGGGGVASALVGALFVVGMGALAYWAAS